MRSLYAGVTVAAVDPVVFDMVLVAEHDRLLRRTLNAGGPSAAVHDVRNRQSGAGEQNNRGDRDLGDRIRCRSKELCHRC